MRRLFFLISNLFFSGFFTVSALDSGCITLDSSSMCPEFNGMAINASLVGATNTADFDSKLRNAISTGTDARMFANIVNCPQLGTQKASPRYKTTFLCQGMVSMCGSNPKDVVCRDTCIAHTNDMQNIFSSLCPSSQQATDFLANFKLTCDNVVPQNDIRNGSPPNCISGAINEKSTCGFQNITAGCSYCQSNSSDACCSSINCNASSSDSDQVRKTIIGVVFGVIGIALVAGMIALLIRRHRQRGKDDGFDMQSDNYGTMQTYGNEKPISNVPEAYSNPMNAPFNEKAAMGAAEGGYDYGAETNRSSFYNDGTTNYETNNDPYTSAEGYDDQTEYTTSKPEDAYSYSRPTDSIYTTATGLTTATSYPRYQVTAPFDPNLDDEIALEVGHIVECQESFDDGWALGTNLSTGKQGAFPMGCVVRIEDFSQDQVTNDRGSVMKSKRVSSLIRFK